MAARKTSIKQRKKLIMQDQAHVYSDLLALVEQALHARIVADALWKYRWERVARKGVGNSVVSFSQVSVENFATQQLWKLFDRKNSVFNIWYVAEHLPHVALRKWLKNSLPNIQDDIDLISEWRHVVVAHRGKAMHFAPKDFEKKFNDARTSERHMQDFLLEFLCQMKFENQRIPIKKTMKELRLGLSSFERHIQRCMIEIYKDADG